MAKKPRKSPFSVRRGRLVGKRRTIVTTKKPHMVFVGKSRVVISLQKGGKKMAGRRPNKPRATVRKSVWTPKGAATHGEIRQKPFSLSVGRPGIDVTKQRGYNVRVRETGPKKRKVII